MVNYYKFATNNTDNEDKTISSPCRGGAAGGVYE